VHRYLGVFFFSSALFLEAFIRMISGMASFAAYVVGLLQFVPFFFFRSLWKGDIVGGYLTFYLF
jgi:hypothetical protein